MLTFFLVRASALIQSGVILLDVRYWLIQDEIRIMISRAVFADDKYSFSTRGNEDIGMRE